jgi:copper chaperone
METRSSHTTKVTAPDIVCGGCAGAIKNALGRIDGVTSVDVNVDTKEVSVEHDDGLSRERIEDILDNAGFPVAQ